MQSKLRMKAFVTDLLKNKLPSTYYYHDYAHTMYVMHKAVEIAHHEKCTEEEIELLITAALWHDTGFIHVYDNHEEEGCALAKKYLPEYGYSNDEIDKICGMIMATKIPQSPKNKLEEIIADADLEYLGTTSASEKANDLFKERQHLNPALTREQWKQIEISFLQKHHYFTEYCKENTAPGKAAYLISLSVA